MLLADTLSRTYSENYERSATESEVECIHATHFLPVLDHQLKELQRETACDPTRQFVKKAILDGFPVQRKNNQQPFTSTLESEMSSQDMMGPAMHHNADPETKDQAEATRLPYWVYAEHRRQYTGQA